MKNNRQTEEDNRDSGLLSNPLSFLRSGSIWWNYAGLYNRGDYGYYWSPRTSSTTGSNGLVFGNTYLELQYSGDHGYGFAVHCTNPSPLSLILAIL